MRLAKSTLGLDGRRLETDTATVTRASVTIGSVVSVLRRRSRLDSDIKSSVNTLPSAAREQERQTTEPMEQDYEDLMSELDGIESSPRKSPAPFFLLMY